MRKVNQLCTLLLLITSMSLLSSCSMFYDQQVTHTKSSVVDYLYPKSNNVVIEPSRPVLKLPLKVGIAFVPEKYSRHQNLTATEKTDLLEKVAEHFRKYPFVKEIEVIPADYLTKGGSFANLEQIKTMYGTDVIALVSYDQVQFNNEDFLSLSYWTIVGAYVVSGEKNDTSTMLDTVVYDISSRKMLFRAPGTSNVKGRSTPVNLSEELRKDSKQGFNLAAVKMIENLDGQLNKFRADLKKNPDKAKIEVRQGYTAKSAGGGAVSVWFIYLLGMLITIRLLLKPFAISKN